MPERRVSRSHNEPHTTGSGVDGSCRSTPLAHSRGRTGASSPPLDQTALPGTRDRLALTLRLSKRERRLLHTVALGAGTLREDVVLTAAVETATRVIAEDLTHPDRRFPPSAGWRFVAAKWPRRNARGLPRLLNEGQWFIFVVGMTTMAWLVRPDDTDLQTWSPCI